MANDLDSGADLTPQEDVRPCGHMEHLVNSYADGTLKGPALWYTQFHVMHCGQCRAAARNLKQVIVRVSELREAPDIRLAPERRTEIDRALDRIDEVTQDQP